MNLSYDVFVNDPPPQDGLLPNGEPKRFSPMASTLIYGSEHADRSVLHIPDLGLVVAADVIHNGFTCTSPRARSSAASGPGGTRSAWSRRSSPGISSAATRTSSSTTMPFGPFHRPAIPR